MEIYVAKFAVVVVYVMLARYIGRGVDAKTALTMIFKLFCGFSMVISTVVAFMLAVAIIFMK